MNRFLLVLIFLSFFCACSSPELKSTAKESYEDYSNPAKTLETFFRAGHDGSIDVVARCYLDWDNVVARSESYKVFIEHIRMETQDTSYSIFKVGREDNLLELGIEITSEKPYFRRRDFYYFDYYKGKWLIVTSGWMKDLGC